MGPLLTAPPHSLEPEDGKRRTRAGAGGCPLFFRWEGGGGEKGGGRIVDWIHWYKVCTGTLLKGLWGETVLAAFDMKELVLGNAIFGMVKNNKFPINNLFGILFFLLSSQSLLGKPLMCPWLVVL